MTTLELTENDHFEAWLREVDGVCLEKSGLSYRDLSNQTLKDWYKNGMTPKTASFQMMQNLDAEEVYYQEYNNFRSRFMNSNNAEKDQDSPSVLQKV